MTVQLEVLLYNRLYVSPSRAYDAHRLQQGFDLVILGLERNKKECILT